MANSYNTNPISIVGSVSSFKASSASVLGTLNTLIVQKLRWVNPGNSKTLSIGDPVSGTVLEILQSDSSGDAVDVLYIPPRIWSDFAVDSFPGGQLLVYVR
jgi:hypothetical protein